VIAFIFYIFAALLIFAAIRVVTVKNPVYAALYLILAFFSAAAIWILLEAEFLGITLVLVYVGAVMVLFLFVVMMLDIHLDVLRENIAQYFPIGIGVALLILVEMSLVLLAKFGTTQFPQFENQSSNIIRIGQTLYGEYVYPFEIAAVILLVAMLTAMVLTLRGPRSNKKISSEEQIQIKREERIRIVKMSAEQ